MKKTITKEEISELPQALFDGPIHVITSRQEYLRSIEVLIKEPVLGFDTETRPAFKKGVRYDVSLLQLSTRQSAYLFRLNHYSLGDELKAILADKKIIKTGVAVRDDIKGLRRLNDFEPASFHELSDMAKKLEIKQLGLRSLTAILLNQRVSKKFKLTNWEKPSLTEEQLRYAATDAWLGLLLYEKLNQLLAVNEES